MELEIKRPIHSLLPCWGELLQFDLRCGNPTDQEADTLLTCSHFNVSDDKQRIHRSKTISIKVQYPNSEVAPHKQSDVTIIKCATVALEPLGLCRPVVVLAFTHSKINTWFTVYVYVPESSRFATLSSFIYPENVNLSEAYTDLLDGPAVFCHYQSSIFFCIWNSRSNIFQCSQHTVAFTAPNSIKLVFRENQKNFLLLATIPSHSNGDESELFEKGESSLHNSDWLVLRANHEQLEIIKGLEQLPYAYTTVTKKLLMLGYHGDDDFEESILLATSLAQLVFVRPDCSCRICDLPFGDVTAMCLSSVKEWDKLVLVSSKANGICCVDLTTFTILKYWPDCVAAFVDDFLVVGSDQILLIKDANEIEGSGFILTDLVQSWPSHQFGVDDSKNEDCAHQSMLNAVSALELRLQSSSNFLQRLQLQSCQKKTVIQKGRLTLDEMTSQSGNKAKYQPDLIKILGDDDGTSHQRHNVSLTDNIIPLKTESFWKRIIGTKFICGVLVMNCGVKPISDICILLVPTTSCSGCSPTISTHCKLMFPSEDSHLTHGAYGDDHSNSYLQEGNKCWVTIATDCPMFDSTPLCNFDVVLVWNEWTKVDCQLDTRRYQERRKCLLNCSLSFDDLEKLTVDLSSRRIKSGDVTKIDFLALDCIQLHSWLSIATRYTGLRKVPSILCTDFSFVHVTMDTNVGLYCDSGHLSGIRLFYHLDGQTTMKLLVNTWDRHQLVLFLRNLFSILPSDASVTALSPDEDDKAKVKDITLKHLQNEMDGLKRMAKEISREEHSNKDLSKEDIMKLRLKSDSAMMKLAKTTSSR